MSGLFSGIVFFWVTACALTKGYLYAFTHAMSITSTDVSHMICIHKQQVGFCELAE